MNAGGDRAVVAPVRVLLGLAAALVFLAGLQLFVFPLRTAEWFAWTIGAPMTAVFLGAAYWSAGVLEVAGARSHEWGRAGLAVWPVFVFTTLTLVVSLVHLHSFHLGSKHPTSARVVTWGWLAIYALVPIGLLVAARIQAATRPSPAGTTTNRTEPAATTRRPLPTGLRVLLAALAVVLLATGVALLALPVTAVAGLWPWPLTPLTAHAIGAWLVGLGWAAGQAYLINDVAWVQPLAQAGVAFLLLAGLALARYGEALEWTRPAAAGFVAVLVGLGAAGFWGLALEHGPRLRARRQP